jgi:crotonobetainyl-CoA:carnitine CoA-transferase CaiB-like acyl-CoA transferase
MRDAKETIEVTGRVRLGAGTGPLSGLTVVEVASYIAGPYSTGLLSELGADVIKVETDAGDPFRGFADPSRMSPHFAAFNRGKRSAVLTIGPGAPDRATFEALIGKADVFVHNLRPGGIERNALDYPTLRAINPRLIYCEISGFGAGEHAERPAYDTVGQALSGLLDQSLDPDAPRLRGPALSDILSAMVAANAILAALFSRQSTGCGQKVDVSMVGATASVLIAEYVALFESGHNPDPRMRPAASQAFVLPCKDGRLVSIHLSSPEKFWHALVETIDAPELLTDPRFLNRSDRVRNFETLQLELEQHFLTLTQEEWADKLENHGVPYARVRNLEQAAHGDRFDPPVSMVTVEDASGKKWTHPAVPATFSGTPVGGPGPPPLLGENTAEIKAVE